MLFVGAEKLLSLIDEQKLVIARKTTLFVFTFQQITEVLIQEIVGIFFSKFVIRLDSLYFEL